MSDIIGSLDTNALLRLLLNDIPHQHSAMIKLYKNTSKQFIVSDIAINEIVFVLDRHYNFTRLEISNTLEGIFSLQKIICNQELFQLVLSIYIDHPSLSLEDCYLSCYAKHNSAEPLWTFDKKLANQTKNAVLIK